MILQDLYIRERITIDENTVRVVPRLDLAQLMLAHEELRNAGRGSDDGFVGREAKEVGEMGDVSSVCAVRCPCESVISTVDGSQAVSLGDLAPPSSILLLLLVATNSPSRKDHNASTVHFTHGEHRCVEFALVAYLFGLGAWVSEALAVF